jgi:membrane protein involved in colicin uptake
MPEISTLLQSLIAYLDQQTLESKHRLATHTEVSALIQQGYDAIKGIAVEATNTPAPAKKTRTKAVIESVKAEGAEPVAELRQELHEQHAAEVAHDKALSEKDAKALAQYQADAAHAIALEEAKAKAKADAERLAAMNAEKPAELDYEKDVAPAIRNHAIDVNKRGAVMDALLTYGVKNGKALAPKDYASFLKHLEEQVAAAALGMDWYDYMDSLEAKA